jgi:hypothetical protein
VEAAAWAGAAVLVGPLAEARAPVNPKGKGGRLALYPPARARRAEGRPRRQEQAA